MGIAYKMRCKNCGTQFDYSADQSYGMMAQCVGCGDYVETESPIRCPSCMKRLNTTQKEFNEQVEMVTMWD